MKPTSRHNMVEAGATSGLFYPTIILAISTVILAISTALYTLYTKKQANAVAQQNQLLERQLLSLTHQNNLARSNLIARIIEEIGSDRARKQRRIVLKHPGYKVLESSYPERPDKIPSEIPAARPVAVSYDRIGLISKFDRELRGELISWHAQDISRIWRRLKPYADRWREELRPVPEFEALGEETLEHLKKSRQK